MRASGPKIRPQRRITIWDATVVTSTVEEPDKLIEVPGTIAPSFMPTIMSEFTPQNAHQYSLFEPGASGSPIFHEGAVIGVITHSSLDLERIGGITFGPWFNEVAEQTEIELDDE